MMMASGGQRPPLNIHSDLNSFSKDEGVPTKSLHGTAKNSAKVSAHQSERELKHVSGRRASRRDESKGSLVHKKSSVEKSIHDSHRSGGEFIKIEAVLGNLIYLRP
mmetsp:Transcript_19364/g.29694  ORF Transcript_19364/g.29694 Transcript_19364/m.29694 type:complete len:106 (+) Transcript_19364:1021-1338(+)